MPRDEFCQFESAFVRQPLHRRRQRRRIILVAPLLDRHVPPALDPTERHGFEYQSWFGFTIFAEGVRGTLGRGGTYRIGGSDEPATGFSLYPEELVEALKAAEPRREAVFLPLGHDRAAAARLRAEGWRTVAALSESDDAVALGCGYVLKGDKAARL